MRIWMTVAGLIILVAGLTIRTTSTGAFSNYAGDALYAALVYALVVFFIPKIMPIKVAMIGIIFCWTVELLQLTPYPAMLSQRNLLARLVLGSTFNPPDLLAYCLGIL